MHQLNNDGATLAEASATAPEHSDTGGWSKPVITRVPLELTLFNAGSGGDGEAPNTQPPA